MDCLGNGDQIRWSLKKVRWYTNTKNMIQQQTHLGICIVIKRDGLYEVIVSKNSA